VNGSTSLNEGPNSDKAFILNFITLSNGKEVKRNGMELFKKYHKRKFVEGRTEESNKGSDESSHIQDINL
jgi:hypothetical protein